jgi:hypothetical protein
MSVTRPTALPDERPSVVRHRRLAASSMVRKQYITFASGCACHVKRAQIGEVIERGSLTFLQAPERNAAALAGKAADISAATPR